MTLKIEDGYCKESPVWKKGAKNWLAVISRDSSQAGGLGRRFIPTLPKYDEGPAYAVEGYLEIGDPIEFGCNANNWQKYPDRERYWGVVENITEDYLEVTEYSTPLRAMKEAAKRDTAFAVALRKAGKDEAFTV